MPKVPYDWGQWVKEKGIGESKIFWALGYLLTKGAPACPPEVAATKHLEQLGEEQAASLLDRWISALVRLGHSDEALRKMRLTWTTRNHRNRARRDSKKSYTFLMQTSIEHKLRRLSAYIGTPNLAETVEYLITHGDELRKEFNEIANKQIGAEKAKLDARLAKPARTTIGKQQLAHQLSRLEQRMDAFERQFGEGS